MRVRIFGAQARLDHEPITRGDYLVWRFGKAFSYRSEAREGAGAALPGE